MSIVNALTCPNCGAAVNLPAAHEEIVKCPYCGTTLQLPHEPGPELKPGDDTELRESMHEALEMARPRSKPSVGGRIVGILITLVIIGGIGIGLFAALFPVIGPKAVYLYDGVVPLVPSEKSAPDLAAVVRYEDEDNIRLAVLDGATRQTQWVSSESWKDDSSHLPPLPGGDLIFFLDQNRLMAYQTATGKVAWQQNLANTVGSGCEGCLRLVDGKLLLLSQEGTLQALDPSNGKPVWAVSLNDSPRQLLLADGKPAVVVRDSNKDNVFQIYDTRTGKLLQEYGGGCQATGPGMVASQGLEGVYLSPDGSQAYLTYYTRGFDSPPCAQQVNLAAGKVNWTATPKDKQVWPSAWFAAEVLVSDQGIFFYEDNSFSVIDAKTGALRFLFKEPRYRQVTPLVSQPGLVVALAIPDFNSESKELWGIDTATGKKLWTYKMQAKSIIDPYTVKLTSAGLVVVQCLADPKVSQWETLDPVSGASLGLKQISDTNYNFLEDAWTPTTAYLKIDNTLYTVDVKTGSVEYTWP